MRLKPTEFQIDTKNPFLGDELGREKNAKSLTNLISTIQEPFVLAVEAGWGRGKTTFIRMWKQSLENEDYCCLLYNAWENDFVADPLVSLFGEISVALAPKTKKSKAQALLKEGKSLLASVAKQSIPIAAKIASYGILDTDKIIEVALGSGVEKIVENSVDGYKQQKDVVKQFRSKLESFVQEVRGNEGGDGKPIVFFIDELDRCRPTYAVELLERIKHLFSVRGLVFVLAMDTEQLAHSVRTLYGSNMNADGYLRRFIDLAYRLPDPPARKYPDFLFKSFDLETLILADPGRNRNDFDYMLDTFTHMVGVFSLSLRDQEQCVSRLNLIVRLITPGARLYPIPLMFLLCLKAHDVQLYHQFMSEPEQWRGMREKLIKTTAGNRFFNEPHGDALDAYFEIGFGTRQHFDSNMNKWHTRSENGEKNSGIKWQFGKEISDANHIGKVWQYLWDKIEMAEQFSEY